MSRNHRTSAPLARLIGGQDRRFAALNDMLRLAHRMGGIRSDEVPDNEPAEQHADRGEVLLDARLFEAVAHRLDVGRDVHRLDVDKLLEAARVAPGKEAPARPVVGFARVGVLYGDREELQEATRSPVADRSAAQAPAAVPSWPTETCVGPR